MELLKEYEVKFILEKCGYSNIDSFQFVLQNYSEELVGYLGEHLKLIIDVKAKVESRVILFVKCIPRFDEYKAQYLRETTFFKKEFVLLSSLFNQFVKYEGTRKWHPELLYAKDNVLVFEDVTEIGYTMPDCKNNFTYEETVATVEAMAKFHAQSFILENSKSKELKRPYSIWEDFGEYLSEPARGQMWRDTGRNGVMDYLKTYSAYKDEPNFILLVDKIIPDLFDRANNSAKPSSHYRNVVVHRDIWANNVFFKPYNGELHALIVDFQTALYACPMIDLTAAIFINTRKEFRLTHTKDILDVYYNCLKNAMEVENLNVSEFISREQLSQAYEESILFGIIQASLIVPIIMIPADTIDGVRDGGEKNHEFDSISRSSYFIDSAKNSECYYDRVSELFDEIVERYILPILKSK
ncbi:uncharacterized protein LOC119830922 [Zerene cesonia]|uniref:uncharacterized protein LOC119830922 n=1 Tax=Zerene cesonia TaxID=33412 RepID=UPI0018E59424|nr:uncharacterized protein LOC119830922 [Zerene cesonia]